MHQIPPELLIFILTTTTIILLLLTVILLIVFFYKRNQNKFIKELEKIKLDSEKNLLNAQLEIQENTLDHISREIHDNISLSLTLAKLHLSTAESHDVTKQYLLLKESEDLIGRAINDLRGISSSLNHYPIMNNGLIKTVEEEINRIERTGKFQIKLLLQGNIIFLDTKLELVIFRIIQEALNNIIKHSNASLIQIILNYHNDFISFTIKDDGKGFDLSIIREQGKGIKGLGIGNIKTRVKMFNGSCSIDSIPGQGSSINVTIPFEQNEGKE